jgi:MFS family permease
MSVPPSPSAPSALLARLFPTADARQAWLVVLICFLVLACSFAARAILGLTMPSLELEFGWSRTVLSSGISMALIVMAVVAPVVGALLDRYGPRIILITGLAAIGFGLIGTAFMTEPWHFFVLFGLLAGLGFGTAANHVVGTVVSRRFERNRGVAVGTATSGSTGGQLIVMPALAFLLATVDWRWSFFALAAACFALIPLVWTMTKPEPNSQAAAAAAPAVSVGARLRAGAERFVQGVGSLATDRTFILLALGFFICGVTTTGVIETHLLPYAAACGFPPLEGATAYGLLSAFNVGGMVLAGWLSDKMNRPLLLGAIYVLRGFTFIILMNIVDDVPLLFIFAVMFGLVDYSTLVVTANLVATHIGLKRMGLAMGLLSSSHSIGGAVGAFAGGVLFDLFAKYDWVWMASILLAILAGFLSWGIRESPDRRGRWFGPIHRRPVSQPA